MIRFASTLALAIVLTTAGACRHFQSDPRPLYEGQPRPLADVARLVGPIAKVDGVDVSHQGTLFALLPGCHVVELPKTLGEGTTSGAWSVDIGKVSYAMVMKPGYLYTVDTDLEAGTSASTGNAAVGGVRVSAAEHNSDGKVTAKLSKIHSNADIERCRAEGDNLRAAAEHPNADAGIEPAPSEIPAPPSVDGGAGPASTQSRIREI